MQAEKKLAAEGIEAKGIQGDVRDWDKCQNTVKQAVAAFGRLDILVNCAAGNFMAPAEDLSVIYMFYSHLPSPAVLHQSAHQHAC